MRSFRTPAILAIATAVVAFAAMTACGQAAEGDGSDDGGDAEASDASRRDGSRDATAPRDAATHPDEGVAESDAPVAVGGAPDAPRDAPSDASGAGDSSAPSDGPPDVASEAGPEASSDTGVDASDTGSDVDAGPVVCSPPVHSGSSAVAYQIDPLHAGAQPGDTLALPLCQRWIYDLSSEYGRLSTPVIGNGLVYTLASGGFGGTTGVFALDEDTGVVVWGPMALPPSTGPGAGGVALDGSQVFAVNGAGALAAFDAATGATAWQITLTGEDLFESPPVALGGLVVVNGGGIGVYTYGVRESDGALLWTYMVTDDYSTPAMTSSAVFLHDNCGAAYRVNTATGTLDWSRAGGCTGVGDHATAMLDGLLYFSDTAGITPTYGFVVDPASGALDGSYDSAPTPAASGGVGYFVPHTTLTLAAIPLGTSTPLWVAGSNILTPPIVVGSSVVVGNYTELDVFSVADGSLLSKFPRAMNWNGATGLPGMQEADGILVGVSGTALVAF